MSTSLEFLGYTIAAPVFISCMTGGSEEGFRANKNLARAAEALKVPVGIGSIRVAVEHEEVFNHFHLKTLAPSVPVLANIGGVQLRDLPHDRLLELIKRLEADSLVVHLNPGQELFQVSGDRDFRGVKSAIERFCEICPVPVMVKETGFGIDPGLVPELVSLGVAYVDVAGAGGTNWISVESHLEGNAHIAAAAEFQNWGMSTALILASVRRRFGSEYEGTLIASGGIRSGLDFAKAIALGSVIAGAALPFIRAEAVEGADGVSSKLEHIVSTIRRVMTMVGVASVDELRHTPIWYESSLIDEVNSIFAHGTNPRREGIWPSEMVMDTKDIVDEPQRQAL